MSVIKINTFGGEIPSASSRALPPTAARISRNLLATSSEFRPLLSDVATAISAVSNPKTLYRLARTSGGAFNANTSSGWVTNAAVVNYAKGQIDDDLTERTYYTFGDGSAAPRVLNAQGANKLLGVPPPTAPTVVATISNEYSADEDRAARVRIPIELADAVKASLTYVPIGEVFPGAPSTTASGWVPHETAVAAGLTVTSTPGEYAFLCPMVGGAMKFPDATGFLLTPDFGGREVSYGGNAYWAVPITLQGKGYTFSSPTFIAALKLIANPDPYTVREVGADFDTTTQLLKNGDITGLSAALATEYDPNYSHMSVPIADLEVARRALERSIINYQDATVLSATVTDFYLKSDVADEITTAIANFATAVVAAEQGVLNPPSY